MHLRHLCTTIFVRDHLLCALKYLVYTRCENRHLGLQSTTKYAGSVESFQKVFHRSTPQVKLFNKGLLALYLIYITIDVYRTTLRHVSGADQHWWFLRWSHYSISEWWLHEGWCICGLRAWKGGMGGLLSPGGVYEVHTSWLQDFYNFITILSK